MLSFKNSFQHNLVGKPFTVSDVTHGLAFYILFSAVLNQGTEERCYGCRQLKTSLTFGLSLNLGMLRNFEINLLLVRQNAEKHSFRYFDLVSLMELIADYV